MKKVGLVGWRGLVGSVLMRRLHDEGDFKKLSPYYFSTSSAGASHRDQAGNTHPLGDAMSPVELADMDIIVSCQGGDYTKAVYPLLRQSGWTGYWIDAASAKRMDDDSLIVLDPINRRQIDAALDRGIKNFIGGNCSITMTLMGLAGLLRADLVEWMSIMTYQAASGAGAAQVRELFSQMDTIAKAVDISSAKETVPALALIDQARETIRQVDFPTKHIGAPLAGGLIGWIDTDLGNGMSREEWKGEVETNKILGLAPSTIKVDGLCIRIGAVQCHSAAVTMKLKKNIPIPDLETMISDAHEWVDYIPNTKAATISGLSPAAVSGTLRVGVGRLRAMSIDDRLYSVFTVGDQLLWGAAEPLRRMLNILLTRS